MSYFRKKRTSAFLGQWGAKIRPAGVQKKF